MSGCRHGRLSCQTHQAGRPRRRAHPVVPDCSPVTDSVKRKGTLAGIGMAIVLTATALPILKCRETLTPPQNETAVDANTSLLPFRPVLASTDTLKNPTELLFGIYDPAL